MVERLGNAVDKFLNGSEGEERLPTSDTDPSSAAPVEIVTDEPTSAEARLGQKAIAAPDPDIVDDRMYTVSRGGRQVQVNPLYL